MQYFEFSLSDVWAGSQVRVHDLTLETDPELCEEHSVGLFNRNGVEIRVQAWERGKVWRNDFSDRGDGKPFSHLLIGLLLDFDQGNYNTI